MSKDQTNNLPPDELTADLGRRGFLGALAGGLIGPANAIPQTAPPQTEPPPAESGESSPVSIGNYHAFMPGGIAFVRDNAVGIVLEVGWGNRDRPGSAAPDYSINRILWNQDGSNIHFDWGRVGSDAAVGRLRADSAVSITLKLPSKTWFPFHAVYDSTPSGLCATAITYDGQFVPWRLLLSAKLVSNHINALPEAAVEIELTPDKPLYFSAGFGNLPELDRVDELLNNAAAVYEKKRAKATGEWGDFLAAIADNLNNSKLYSSYTRRVCHIVGRKGWVTDPDYPPIFCWDSFFNALLASLEDPVGARNTVRTAFLFQTPEGMVANFAGWNRTEEGTMSIGRSQPPVGALCIWKVHQRWPDIEFLREIYPKLLKWHDWWPKHRDGNKNGLLEWGSATGIFQDARYATGWDDSPQWDGVRMIGTQMNCDAVDLNALWAMDSWYLSLIAGALGNEADASRLRQEHAAMNDRINRVLWNEERGLYCHRFWNEQGESGRFITRLTPANFYPLICGAPDEGRARRMLAVLTDPRKFWGQWMIPTLPYDDPDWWVQEYWKGHIWAPVNYLVWQGLQRYGTPDQKAQFARSSVDIFMRNWREHGTCNENFSSKDGSGDDYPHYTWGALMCQIGLESLCEINQHGRLIPQNNPALREDIELTNVPASGNLYRVRAKNGKAVVSSMKTSSRL